MSFSSWHMYLCNNQLLTSFKLAIASKIWILRRVSCFPTVPEHITHTQHRKTLIPLKPAVMWPQIKEDVTKLQEVCRAEGSLAGYLFISRTHGASERHATSDLLQTPYPAACAAAAWSAFASSSRTAWCSHAGSPCNTQQTRGQRRRGPDQTKIRRGRGTHVLFFRWCTVMRPRSTTAPTIRCLFLFSRPSTRRRLKRFLASSWRTKRKTETMWLTSNHVHQIIWINWDIRQRAKSLFSEMSQRWMQMHSVF